MRQRFFQSSMVDIPPLDHDVIPQEGLLSSPFLDKYLTVVSKKSEGNQK